MISGQEVHGQINGSHRLTRAGNDLSGDIVGFEDVSGYDDKRAVLLPGNVAQPAHRLDPIGSKPCLWVIVAALRQVVPSHP